MQNLKLAASVLILVIMIVGCAGTVALPASTPTASTPAPTRPAIQAASGSPSDAAKIYENISPAVAYITTELGSGSGAILFDDYVITSAHVVWPHTKATVVLPDGTEYTEAPVKGWDLLRDLAVIGPMDLGIAPLTLADGEQMPVGSEVYLIGYPGEDEVNPQPSITRGIISRFREWENAGLTYIQGDPTVLGGQSGGILVTPTGEVIGISGFEYPDRFALVTSITDIEQHLSTIITGADLSAAENRMLPTSGGGRSFTETFQLPWDSAVYVPSEPYSDTISVTVTSDIDVSLDIVEPFGYIANENDLVESGVEKGEISFYVKAPFFVAVRAKGYTPGEVAIEADGDLIPFIDSDDGRTISPGEMLTGAIDYHWDVDAYEIELEAGQMIRLYADSMLGDPMVSIDLKDSPATFSVEEETGYDSMGDFRYWSAELDYEAPETGTYVIFVRDQLAWDSLYEDDVTFVVGSGYLLLVDEIDPEEENSG